jgi:hypothetical protein
MTWTIKPNNSAHQGQDQIRNAKTRGKDCQGNKRKAKGKPNDGKCRTLLVLRRETFLFSYNKYTVDPGRKARGETRIGKIS